MPKPKVLSGAEVIRIFASFGFQVVSQRGSHVKLRRTLADGTRQTVTVPNHHELDRGTLLAIHRQALRHLRAEELGPHFFSN